MEDLKRYLSFYYDFPGVEPNGLSPQLGIPKDHPNNPWYPGTCHYHYSCTFEDYQKIIPVKDLKLHWDYRGNSSIYWSCSLNPHKDLHMIKSLGLCLPMFQRNFKTKLDAVLAPEFFDNLQPMFLSCKLA